MNALSLSLSLSLSLFMVGQVRFGWVCACCVMCTHIIHLEFCDDLWHIYTVIFCRLFSFLILGAMFRACLFLSVEMLSLSSKVSFWCRVWTRGCTGYSSWANRFQKGSMAKYFRECQESSSANVGARSKASSYSEASAWYFTHLLY